MKEIINTKIDLLPCPFCGNESEITKMDGGGYVVGCGGCAEKHGCGAEIGFAVSDGELIGMFDTAEDAAEMWNMRSSPPKE